MMFYSIVQFLIGVVLVYLGSDYLIKGSKFVAIKFNISPIIIGITLVALGTSLPELLISILATLKGEPGMVIGNVIGSNIANIGLVLGCTAVLTPIILAYYQIRYDLFFVMFISILLILCAYLDKLDFYTGIFFLLLLSGYCFYLYKKENNILENSNKIEMMPSLLILIKLILGILFLAIGVHLFVEGATGIAILLGISSVVIGMSIVALGTSLPELAASLTAAKEGENSFVIGNIIGSNIINILVVLGLSIIIHPIMLEFSEIYFHLIIMIFLTVFLFVIIRINGIISRYSAIFLVLVYIIFLYFNFQNKILL